MNGQVISNFCLFRNLKITFLPKSDFAYAVMGWFPAGNRIGDSATNQGGATRIPSHYDDPELQALTMESIGISSTALGYAKSMKKLGNFGTVLSKLASGIGFTTNTYSTSSAFIKDRSTQDTVEFVIEGFDKEFIGIVAPYAVYVNIVAPFFEKIMQRFLLLFYAFLPL
ncbi:MAG: hypothetical protein PF448_09950 [Bacteroidales bacterium]|jgi:hypothetical protein|nr:hypothetical protein [Bacteroidales bacterium]